ncbi:MAG: diaminopimelate epimerase [Bacteroidota bacterium]
MGISIDFYKFHGTMNDFVMVDGSTTDDGLLDAVTIQRICNRFSGVGADGLIVLKKEPHGLRMVYYNSDGNQSSMCGNGGRCFAAFAHMLGLCGTSLSFDAIDGKHEATLLEHRGNTYTVSLSMNDVDSITALGACDFTLDTGSPHFVRITHHVDSMDVFHEGRKIRQSPPFEKDGINVNFIEPANHGVRIRTYERGVEAETKACGTGSVAAAVVAYEQGLVGSTDNIQIITQGGLLQVSFHKSNNRYTNIRLTGPAEFVFKGTYHSI